MIDFSVLLLQVHRANEVTANGPRYGRANERRHQRAWQSLAEPVWLAYYIFKVAQVWDRCDVNRSFFTLRRHVAEVQ